MATNQDSFVITAAMLTMAWVKPAVTLYTVAGGANATDDYLPKLLTTKAGCPGGTGSAVVSPFPPGQVADPNYVFASTIDVDQERKPYPNTISTAVAVDTNPTMSISNIET